MKKIIVYFITINIITFMLFGIDKLKAKFNKWRIKESYLILLCIMGGALACVISMKLFNHKKNKNLFKYLVPFILFIQIIIFWVMYFEVI